MRRRALSPIVSTMLLVSAMLIVILAVLGFSINLFAVQTQDAEFIQAQNLMVNFAQGVDAIQGNPGASTYVTFNARAGGPNLVPNWDTFIASLNFTCSPPPGHKYGWSGNTSDLSPPGPLSPNGITFNVNVLRYRMGPLVSFQGFQWIRGPVGNSSVPGQNKTMLIQNSTNPNGWVFLSHFNPAIYPLNPDSGSTWVTLDHRRANVLNLGLFNVSKGIIFKANTYKSITNWTNFIQVTYTNVSFPGSPYGGANNIVVTATNKAVKVYTCFINNLKGSQAANACVGNTYYHLALKVSHTGNPIADHKVYKINIPCNHGSGKNTAVSTQVQFVVSNIQIYLSGG